MTAIQNRHIETAVGLFVALGIAALLVLALKVSNLTDLSTDKGYSVTALFDNVGGLKVRSAVTLAGVKIGRVSAIELEDKNYQARVTFTISSRYSRIPADSSASIFTAGLLGEQYVSLQAGGEETFLKEGSRIPITQSAVVLEEVIGQFLFSQSSNQAGNNGQFKP